MRIHLWILTGVLLVTGLLYLRVPGTYYCGFDDFIDLHRAQYDASGNNYAALTSSFHVSQKYRPFGVILNNLTYRLGHGSPRVFRTRNLIAHLVNAILVYGMGMLLFHSPLVAGTAALLFGVHPLCNQGIMGAVWGFTPTYAGLWLALLLFLLSVRRKPASLTLLVLSLVCGWVTLMAYDAALAFFGLPFCYLGIWYLFTRERLVSRRYLVVLVLLTITCAGSYFALRARYLPPGKSVPVSVVAIARNAALYAAAPCLLLDPVLANEWFGTPLPSEALYDETVRAAFLLITIPSICVLIFLIIRAKWAAARLRGLEWPQMLFLLVAIAASLSPFLVFSDHPSESYLYAIMPFVLLLFSRVFCRLTVPRKATPWRPVYLATLAVLLVLFGLATWVRTGRVIRCADTAKQILSSLPSSGWREGLWHILLAPVPGEPVSPGYGLYAHYGTDTLGTGDYGAGAVQMAMRVMYGNPEIVAEVISPDELTIRCRAATIDRTPCFWVHRDGRVSAFTK